MGLRDHRCFMDRQLCKKMGSILLKSETACNRNSARIPDHGAASQPFCRDVKHSLTQSKSNHLPSLRSKIMEWVHEEHIGEVRGVFVYQNRDIAAKEVGHPNVENHGRRSSCSLTFPSAGKVHARRASNMYWQSKCLLHAFIAAGLCTDRPGTCRINSQRSVSTSINTAKLLEQSSIL